jgi:hypothetical protein
LTGIDLSLVAGLPGLIALIVCLRRGPERAFLNVYLPALVLVPDSCRMSLSGQFSFGESAILPIALFYLWNEGRNWKWSFTDCVVLAFVWIVLIAEYMDADLIITKNIAIHLTVTILMPYVVAKGLSAREGMSVEIAKRIVILATVVAIASLYEFRMSVNLFRAIMTPLFPQDMASEIPQFRYGVVRIAGPWAHPILAGIILAVAYRLARWLEWTGTWRENVPSLPISKVRFCEILLLVASVMTISRGPWLGALAAGMIVFLLRARHRTYVTAFAILAVFILTVPASDSLDAYMNGSSGSQHDEAQASAAYRREMNQKYIMIVEERPTLGWGVSLERGPQYPIIDGMSSIDNQYLLLALLYGVYALAAVVLILLWVSIRLGIFSVFRSYDDPATSLAVTLSGILVIYAISITTVYLGAQTQPILFMIAGWAEALLAQRVLMTAEVSLPARRVTYRFERVMV